MMASHKNAALLAALIAALFLAGCDSSDDNGSGNPNLPTLTVAKSGTGTGTVTSNPPGIDCGAACSRSFAAGTVVTLTAAPSVGSSFSGWTGGGCAGTGTCVTTVTTAVTVTAQFTLSVSGTLGNVVALTATNKVISFNRSAPETLSTLFPITGLNAGEQVLGFDIRPAANAAASPIAYGITSQNRLVQVNPKTGVAVSLGNLSAAAGDTTSPFAGLDNAAGVSFGVDFNPQADLLRVVSSNGQNLRIVPEPRTINGVAQPAGAVFTDTGLNTGGVATAGVTGAAYTNNFPNAAGTLLYVINSNSDRLLIVNPPNDGTLSDVGPLGGAVGDITDVGGFDIIGSSLDAAAIVTAAGAPRFVTINLVTGQANTVGSVGGGEAIRGMSMLPTAGSNATGDTFALTAANQLMNFNRSSPGSVLSRTVVAGLQGGESLIGIDFRPLDGALYGVSSTGRIYQINTTNGLGTFVAALTPDPADATDPFAGLEGTNFGLDFDPVDDSNVAAAAPSLRVVSNTGQNIRINLHSGKAGQVTTDTDLNRGADGNGDPIPANATAAAYINSFRDAGFSQVLVIDTATDNVAVVSTAAATQGQLTNRGPLGFDAEGVNGFDIDGFTGLAFAVLRSGGTVKLYRIALSNGAATAFPDDTQSVLGSEDIRGLALRLPLPPRVYGVSGTGSTTQLHSFNVGTPGTLTSVGVSAIGAAEQIIGMDFRPADRVLFAVTSNGKVYALNPITGAAVLQGTMLPSPNDPTSPFSSLSGTAWGVDFNPSFGVTEAQLTILSNNGQFVRTSVACGTAQNCETFTDGNTVRPSSMFPLPPPIGAACTPGGAGQINAAAYVNNVPGSSGGELFAIDQGTNCLYTVAVGPTASPMTLVAPLGVTQAGGAAGFDIAGGTNGLSLAAMLTTSTTQSTLYRINLATSASSAATAIGPIGDATTPPLNALTILLAPQP